VKRVGRNYGGRLVSKRSAALAAGPNKNFPLSNISHMLKMCCFLTTKTLIRAAGISFVSIDITLLLGLAAGTVMTYNYSCLLVLGYFFKTKIRLSSDSQALYLLSAGIFTLGFKNLN